MYALALKGKTSPDLFVALSSLFTHNPLILEGSIPTSPWYCLIRFDETFSFQVGNIKEVFHPARLTASRKKKAQQMQMCNDKDRGDQALVQAKDKRGEDSKGNIEKGKGLRNSPPQVRKKKRKESEKFDKKVRNHEEGSSKGKFEEDKARKKIELKYASVDDLISKLKAFKGALHNNKSLNTHLVQDHSKWK
ncbi:hypothetical protein PIB30_056779 [Stylosanthes scabra]|uniref:Uncharacterized protein n=1 Tax=Stylosanthes scabra TaxID=79078 RepID=A0ABU6XIH9_9FABA|nr:hypothetical protein [Stylosanthes scabra]